jgi:hypothetical protein
MGDSSKNKDKADEPKSSFGSFSMNKKPEDKKTSSFGNGGGGSFGAFKMGDSASKPIENGSVVKPDV